MVTLAENLMLMNGDEKVTLGFVRDYLGSRLVLLKSIEVCLQLLYLHSPLSTITGSNSPLSLCHPHADIVVGVDRTRRRYC